MVVVVVVLSVSKSIFYVFKVIFTVFVEAPLVVEALSNCPVCPPLNPALDAALTTSL